MTIRKDHLKVIVIIGCLINEEISAKEQDLLNIGFYTDAFKIHQIFTRYYGLEEERVSIFAPNKFKEAWIEAFNESPKLQYGTSIYEVPKEEIKVEPILAKESVMKDQKNYSLFSGIKTDDEDDILLFFLDPGDKHTLGNNSQRVWNQLIIESLSKLKHHTLTVLFESCFSGSIVKLLEANNVITKALSYLNISFEDFSNNLCPFILFSQTSYNIDDFKEISAIITKMDMQKMQSCYEYYLDKKFPHLAKFSNLNDLLKLISKLFKGACETLKCSNPKTEDVLSLYQPLAHLKPSQYYKSQKSGKVCYSISSPDEMKILLDYLQYSSFQDYSEFSKYYNYINTLYNFQKLPSFLQQNFFHIQCFSKVNFEVIQQFIKYEQDFPHIHLAEAFDIFSETHNKRDTPNLVHEPVFVDNVIAISSTDEYSVSNMYGRFHTEKGRKVRLGSIALNAFLKFYIVCKEPYALNEKNWRHFLQHEIDKQKLRTVNQLGYVYSMNYVFPHFAKFAPCQSPNSKIKCSYVLQKVLGWKKTCTIFDYTYKEISNPLHQNSKEEQKNSEEKVEMRRKIINMTEFAYSPWPDYEDESIVMEVASIIDYMNLELKKFGLFFDPFSMTAPYSINNMTTSPRYLDYVFDIYQDANSRFLLSQSRLFAQIAPALANFIRLYDEPYDRVRKFLAKASHNIFGESEYSGCFVCF